jgi:hypothetical protein
MDYSETHNFIDRIKKIIDQKGIFYLFKKTFYKYLFPIYLIFFIKKRRFFFKDKKLEYFFHPQNHTWANERAIEIPLVLSLIKNPPREDILEIGNVLSHYVRTGWDILDKYERSKGVINKDALDFKPFKKYRYIISISTLEHIGFDEIPKDDKKILNTISNLKENCLEKNGKIILTVPIGLNPNLDNLLLKNKIKFSEVYYFKRVGWDNQWTISSKEDVLKTKFAKPYIGANGMVLGVIKN